MWIYIHDHSCIVTVTEESPLSMVWFGYSTKMHKKACPRFRELGLNSSVIGRSQEVSFVAFAGPFSQRRTSLLVHPCTYT